MNDVWGPRRAMLARDGRGPAASGAGPGDPGQAKALPRRSVVKRVVVIGISGLAIYLVPAPDNRRLRLAPPAVQPELDLVHRRPGG